MITSSCSHTLADCLVSSQFAIDCGHKSDSHGLCSMLECEQVAVITCQIVTNLSFSLSLFACFLITSIHSHWSCFNWNKTCRATFSKRCECGSSRNISHHALYVFNLVLRCLVAIGANLTHGFNPGGPNAYHVTVCCSFVFSIHNFRGKESKGKRKIKGKTKFRMILFWHKLCETVEIQIDGNRVTRANWFDIRHKHYFVHMFMCYLRVQSCQECHSFVSFF